MKVEKALGSIVTGAEPPRTAYGLGFASSAARLWSHFGTGQRSLF